MNQVMLVPFVVLSSILLLSAPIAVDTADACNGNSNSSDCCSNAGCGWFQCKDDSSEQVSTCLNLTDSDAINKTCSGSTDKADFKSKCSDAPTISCKDRNNDTCCNSGKDFGCGLFTCGGEQRCWNLSDYDGFNASCTTDNKTADQTNMCESLPVTCGSYNTSSDCCSSNEVVCGWFQCEGDGKLIDGGACFTNSSVNPLNCTAPKTQRDTCKDTPTPTPAPVDFGQMSKVKYIRRYVRV
ncbi:protein psiN-like [Ylistrum balloti]|uniref:protein psiN-like n=1 Tax=Ylistrum balloti TaxID=509963 RepID=UPI002905AE02|nr:protein psiN-like [Ylistrum balloti]